MLGGCWGGAKETPTADPWGALSGGNVVGDALGRSSVLAWGITTIREPPDAPDVRPNGLPRRIG